MKTLVISDIHANIAALEAVWSAESDSDRIICAGDLVDYGPYPCECIDWMIAHNVTVVKGNHDASVVHAYHHPIDDPITSWAVHNARKLSQHHVEYLAGLPETCITDIDGHTYGMTHAYQKYEIIRYMEAFQEFSNSRFGEPLQRLILGHTHRRELHYLADDTFWINPGSVSYRRHDEEDQRAQYAVVEDDHISLRSVAFAVQPLYDYAHRAPIVESDKRHTLMFFGPRPRVSPL